MKWDSSLSVLFAALYLLAPAISGQRNVAEQYLLSALNQERSARGIRPVQEDAALSSAAQRHAAVMASHGTISHRFPGEPELADRASSAGARFNRITENVAMGASVVELQNAWMHSPGHRANILDPEVNSVGIAVVFRDGRLYAVEDFDATVERLTLEQQEASVGILLDRDGLELLDDSDARKTCAMSSGYAGSRVPSYVFRYTSTDLSRLPDRLKGLLAKGREHQAAVGACRPEGGGPFTAYRIAVVLYP